MKDKLYKNHHRGIYYKVKAFFIAFVLLVTMTAVSVIPTYIIIKDHAKEQTNATQEVVDEEPQEDNSEEDPEELLTYDK